MGKIAQYANIFTEYFCKVLLLMQTFIVSWVVIGRYLLEKSPRWGEEASLMAMVWFGLLSASIAVREDSHLRLTLLDLVMPKKYLKYVEIFVVLVILSFALFLMYAGIQLVQVTSNNTLPGLKIASSWLYLAVPVSGLVIFIQIIDKARKLI